MAIDFKNKPDNHNSNKNPFDAGSQKSNSRSAGFSFGGEKLDPKKQPNTNQNREQGFSFGSVRNQTKQTNNGFSNVPAIRPNKPPAHQYRGFNNARNRGSSGLSDVDIPWKATIYICLVILMFGLLVYFWDVITYIFTNLIVMLLLVVLLLLLIRWLLRPRR